MKTPIESILLMFVAAFIGSFGRVLIRVDVTGDAAHASWPEQGINAAVEAARFAARLAEVPLGTHPVIKPSQALLLSHSGPTMGQSITDPDQARIQINWHTAPGERAEVVIARLKAPADSLDSPETFKFSIDDPSYPAWETPLDAPLLTALGSAFEQEFGTPPPYAYTGYGDTNLFSDAEIPTMMFGSLGANFHETDEWVDLNSISQVIRTSLRLTCTLLPRS